MKCEYGILAMKEIMTKAKIQDYFIVEVGKYNQSLDNYIRVIGKLNDNKCFDYIDELNQSLYNPILVSAKSTYVKVGSDLGRLLIWFSDNFPDKFIEENNQKFLEEFYLNKL